MVYFLCSNSLTYLAKLKVSTRGFESIVVIIEYSQSFSYHLRRLDYASVTPDHTENTTKESAQHPKGLILKQNLKTLVQKGAKFMKN